MLALTHKTTGMANHYQWKTQRILNKDMNNFSLYVQTISPTYANHVLSYPQAYLPVMIQQSQGGKKKWYHEVEGKDMIIPIITFGAE